MKSVLLRSLQATHYKQSGELKMNNEEKKIKTDLIAATKAIKKKFQELHNNKIIVDEHLKEQYKPITNSLKTIIENQKDDGRSTGDQKKLKDFQESNYDETYFDHDENDKLFEANSDFEGTPKSSKRANPKKIDFSQNLARDDVITDDDDDYTGNNDIDWSKYQNVLLCKAVIHNMEFAVVKMG